MRYLQIFALVVVAMATACNNSPNSPLDEAIEEQMHAQERGDSIEHRKQARQAVMNHVAKYFSEWSIQGITIYSYRGSVYMVGADSISGDKRQTLFFRVELFVKDDGAMYWKTDYVPLEANAKPFDFVIEPYTSTERKD